MEDNNIFMYLTQLPRKKNAALLVKDGEDGQPNNKYLGNDREKYLE